MRSEREADRAIELYADTVRRICMVHLKSFADTQDVFQNVFLKYVLRSRPFDSDEHEKAWIIRVTINECKDLLKSFFRRRTMPLDELCGLPAENAGDGEVLKAVLSLPPKYRDAVYLYYFEGYSALEVGSILGKNVNSVYTLLSRAKRILKEFLGGEQI